MQEDVLRDTDRDRKQLTEKISALERSLAVSEAKKSKLQVRESIAQITYFIV